LYTGKSVRHAIEMMQFQVHEGNDGEKPRGQELGKPDEDHGSSLNWWERN
jgi:hypothetical protein